MIAKRFIEIATMPTHEPLRKDLHGQRLPNAACVTTYSQLVSARMTLEDHVGDVIGKARKGLGIELEKVAEAAGLSADCYARFEEEGTLEELPDFDKVGVLLGLVPDKLATIATGWIPRAADLKENKTIRQITTNEEMEVHCYLAWDAETREAALFDTGWSPEPILKEIQEHGLSLKHLFITHTHHDHIAALTPVRKLFPEVELHSSSPNAPEQQRNHPDQFVELGALQINVRETPGHADDGATYVIDNFPRFAPKVAVVGDAIFAGSIGGAPNNYQLAREKVQSEILSLSAETIICPGHGPITTVAEQHVVNPFF